MSFSGLPGFYILYLLLTLLLFLLIRRKLIGEPRPIIVYCLVAVAIGALSPVSIETLGFLDTMLILGLSMLLIAFLMIRTWQRAETESHEVLDKFPTNTLMAPVNPGLQPEIRIASPDQITDVQAETEQQTFGQEAIDQLLAEFWESEKQKDEPELLPPIEDKEVQEEIIEQPNSDAPDNHEPDYQPDVLEVDTDWALVDANSNETIHISSEAIQETAITHEETLDDLDIWVEEEITEEESNPVNVYASENEEDQIVYTFTNEETNEVSQLISEATDLEFSYLGDESEQDANEITLMFDDENKPEDLSNEATENTEWLFVDESEPTELLIAMESELTETKIETDLIESDAIKEESIDFEIVEFESTEPESAETELTEPEIIDSYMMPTELVESGPEESELLVDETVATVEEPVGTPQVKLSNEEMSLVQEHYALATQALNSRDFKNALDHLTIALSFPVPIATRYLLVRDYVEIMKQMGLYDKAIQILADLRDEIRIYSENHQLEMEIIHHIEYIEKVSYLVRLYHKPNLPWVFIPYHILEEAKRISQVDR